MGPSERVSSRARVSRNDGNTTPCRPAFVADVLLESVDGAAGGVRGACFVVSEKARQSRSFSSSLARELGDEMTEDMGTENARISSVTFASHTGGKQSGKKNFRSS